MPHVAHCTWLGWCNGSVRALVQRAGALFCIGFALRFYVLSTIVYTVNKFFAGATFVVVFAAIVIVVVVVVAAAAVVVVLLLWGC